MKKRYSKKQLKKLIDGECLVCGENKYELLDAHRIEYGSKYNFQGTVTICCRCHRLTHNDEIKFDKKYFSTGGWLLHWWLGDKEFWTPVKC